MAANIEFQATSFLPDTSVLERCTHCGVSLPSLRKTSEIMTTGKAGSRRVWGSYVCPNCASIILVEHDLKVNQSNRFELGDKRTTYPSRRIISDDVPERARVFLLQAQNSLSQPDAAVMVAASAVDAMLKAKGLTDGSLYARLIKAKESGLITEGMASWGHEVRLSANEQRHADESFTHCTELDARRIFEFAMAIAEFLFVLPARIDRARRSTAT